MDTLQIKKEDAVKAHENAKSPGKKLLEDLFGKKTFKGEVTDRVKTFKDVLDETGKNPFDFDEECEGLSKDEIAYKKLKLIAQALNEGWKPDWGNWDEWKYYPYFTFENGSDSSSGFGYSYDDWTNSRTYTCIGARLCFKTSELAEYAGKQFEGIYQDYLV